MRVFPTSMLDLSSLNLLIYFEFTQDVRLHKMYSRPERGVYTRRIRDLHVEFTQDVHLHKMYSRPERGVYTRRIRDPHVEFTQDVHNVEFTQNVL